MLAFPVRSNRKNQPAPLQKNYCYRCVDRAKAERAPKTAIETGMAKAGNSFFAWLALNFFARWLRRDRQSESRSCASLFVGPFPVSVCDCERRSSDRGFGAAFRERRVRSDRMP